MDKNLSLLKAPTVWRPALTALAICLLVLIFVCCAFTPRWETNDDVGMLMVAQGYGAAAFRSPDLVFSNVLWGYVVSSLPNIGKVQGYSLGTLGVLAVTGAVLLFGLYRLGVDFLAIGAMFVLLMARAMLFPQFTTNAGLLFIAAAMCFFLYAKSDDLRSLAAGCLLALLSYLVRGVEFALLLVIACPLLLSRDLFSRRAFRVALSLLLGAIAVATFIDYRAYQASDWQTFNALNHARAYFTDFGAGELLKKRPDILQRYGYSANDIDLLSYWFFTDRNIANPVSMQAMLAELGPLPAQGNALDNAWLGVRTLWHPYLLPFLFPAIVFSVIRPTRRLMACWLLYVLAVFALGLLGRPGILRLYVPVASLIVMVSFASIKRSGWRRFVVTAVLLVAAAMNFSRTATESRSYEAPERKIVSELRGFPAQTVFVWAAEFPYEAAFPLLNASAASTYSLYSLGTFTWAPFSVAFREEKNGRGMIGRLAEEQGIPVVANETYFRFLAIYCSERLRGTLEELSSQRYGSVVVSQRRCLARP